MELPLATELVDPAGGAPPLLRPLSLGEILDRALQLYRANFVRLLLVMLTFQAPIFAIHRGMQHLRELRAPVLARPGAFLGVAPDASQLLWFAGTFAVQVLLSLLVYQLAVASLTSGAARGFLGERIEVGRSLREGMARAPHLVATFVLLTLWTGLLLLLSALPGAVMMGLGFSAGSRGGVLLGLGGLVLVLALLLIVGLYLVLRYALVSEVVVLEKLSLVRALRRSARLMAGRVGPSALDSCKLRASILYAVNFAISVAVLIVSSLPTFLVNSLYGVSPLDPERYDPALVPLGALLPVEVLGVLAQAAVAPFGLLAIIVFYFDVRIKREGFDLEFLAARLGARPQ